MTEDDLTQREADCRLLVTQFKTLLVSSVSVEGEPDLSYAPFVQDDAGAFYVFVSELAVHTRNLLDTGRCALLFIRDEAASRNLFARERLSFQCVVEEVGRDDGDYNALLARLEQRFGDVVSLLRSLGDFRLLRLCPRRGRYVVGFGRAYDLELPSGRLTAVGPPNPA